MTEIILTEAEERARLRAARETIAAELRAARERDAERRDDLLDLKRFLSENKADMDHVEKVSVRQTVDEMGAVGDHGALAARRLAKLLAAPYFGRIDFRSREAAHPQMVYVGIHSFHDPATDHQWVHDWRAPISSLFYDFEQGPAHYDAPAGRVEGDIERKRQYRIEDGELVFMLESSLNIHDSVLQDELSRTSSDKMKNIVATIQRDQNAIIRNDDARTLVIQGAAGSGKTSIALHRIAFLLYRFKDTIKAEDVLIISPNKVFAHYISNVLPELGEENIAETTMETLATRLLGHDFQFETFAEQVARLLKPGDQPYHERIRYKASPAFLERLDAYVSHLKNTHFTPADVTVGRHTLSAGLLDEWYHRIGSSTVAARINDLVEFIARHLDRELRHEIKGTERTSVRQQLKRMFNGTKLEKLYEGFYAWIEEPALFRRARARTYEYADVYPLIYFKMHMEGMAPFDEVKHLVVDEMQDYTPVQYQVLAHLFPCRKTVLGDAWQSINPLSASKAEGIRDILPGAQCVYLNQTYRSTLPISRLAQRINPNKDLQPMERAGAEPEIIACRSAAAELDLVRELVDMYLKSDYKTLGIVCKTQADATRVFEHVRDLSVDIALIDPGSSVFNAGVTIATAHLAKGLEFDEVILPGCDERTYASEIDRHMLYVGVTRAMHKLTLTHTGRVTPLVAESLPIA